MKKLCIMTALICSSCTVSQMYHKPSYKNSVRNIEVMMMWLEKDVQNGLLREDVARNYFQLLEVTHYGLVKNTKYDKQKD